MKTKSLVLSSCLVGIALVAFACSSTNNGVDTDDPNGATPDNGNGNDDDNGNGNDDGTDGSDAGPSTKDSGKDDTKPPSGSNLCADYCAQADKAKCANAGSCVTDCAKTGTKVPASCNGYYEAFLKCGATATYTCDDKDEPTSSDCDDEGTALVKCVQSAGGKDAGPSDKDAGPGDKDAGPGDKDAGPDDKDAGPKACFVPGDAVKETYAAIGPTGQCTAAQIDAYLAGCLGDKATQATCKTATDAAPNCAACINGEAGDPNKPFVPVLVPAGGGNVSPNIDACIAAVVGKPKCAAAGLNPAYCADATCASCETQADYDTCGDTAMAPGAVCAVDETCKAAIVGATQADEDKCYVPKDFDASFKKVATVLCVTGVAQ